MRSINIHIITHEIMIKHIKNFLNHLGTQHILLYIIITNYYYILLIYTTLKIFTEFLKHLIDITK